MNYTQNGSAISNKSNAAIDILNKELNFLKLMQEYALKDSKNFESAIQYMNISEINSSISQIKKTLELICNNQHLLEINKN